MIAKIKNRISRFISWVRRECVNKRTLALFVLVIVLMYSPGWGGYLLYWIFKWKWCAAVASAYILLWAGPFTPFFPLCMAITLFITRLLEKRRSRKSHK